MALEKTTPAMFHSTARLDAACASTGAEQVFVSAASVWEAVIKQAIGKLAAAPGDLVAGIKGSGFVELPVSAAHTARVAALPNLHRDPFDRLLIAQAIHEPLHLLTADSALPRYSQLVLLV